MCRRLSNEGLPHRSESESDTGACCRLLSVASLGWGLMRPLAAILLAVVLMGCAMSAVVYLQNMNCDVVRCGLFPDTASNTPAREAIDLCVTHYGSKGSNTTASPRFIHQTPPGF